MSKPWDETWVVRGIRNVLVTELERGLGRAMPFSSLNETESMALHSVAALIAAAPAMARLLCRLEWSACYPCGPDDSEHDQDRACPECGAHAALDHLPGCLLDAALSAAGISPEERERVRAT